jgi:menaquinone-specific isochorismate synthase
MTTTLEHEQIYSAKEARFALSREMQEIWQQPRDSSTPKILRAEIAVTGLDLLEWLAAQDNPTRIYFSGRDQEDLEVAGIGFADMIQHPDKLDYDTIFGHINQYLSDTPHLRYYGGFSFAPGHEDDDWHAFGACKLLLPRFELLNDPNRNHTYLACNLLKDRDSLEKVLKEVAVVDFTSKPKFLSPGKPLSRTDEPNHEIWKENLEREIDNIKADKYEKTVLARKVELEFKEKPDPAALLYFLKQLPSRRYDFLFQFHDCCAFVGSSPERLYKRSGHLLVSEAVAGTRSRGQLEHDDHELAEELLHSDKERREHDFVIQTIIEDLEPLCSTMEVEQKKGLLKLKEGQHLITHLTGVLKEGVTDNRLIAALHPTPAVGGCPLNEALTAIQRSESFKRGWYAGIIGTVGVNSADFAVGLRSGRIHNHSLSLYSGVGVVEGSIPEMEWQEVETKIVNFMDIINNGH